MGLGTQYILGFANLNKIELIKGETFIHAVSGYGKDCLESNSHPHY